MTKKHSRRSILASGMSLIGTTLFSSTLLAYNKDNAGKTPKIEALTPAGDDTIKTRTASCNCGQLSVKLVGPDPERISLCHCLWCKKQSGTAFSVQARYPREQATIKGKSTAWRFPMEGEDPAKWGGTCADTGAEIHFCPTCGSTVYYLLDADDQRIGLKVGAFADPNFPAPVITAFEKYSHPWVMNLEELPMKRVHK